MAHSNGIITGPIPIPADINAVLGTSHTDLGTMCRDGNINAWAKFKPVRCLQSGVIGTLDQLNANKRWNENLSTQWWRDTANEIGAGNNSKYGLSPVTATILGTDSGSNSLYAKKNQEWSYALPSGGIASPYRQSDFHQYNHNVPTPSGKFICDNQLILQSTADGGWTLNAALLDTEGDEASLSQRDYITPADVLSVLWGVETVYFGFAVFDSTGKAMIWVTGNKYAGAGARYLSKGATYTVMGFYSSNPLPEDFSSELNGAPCSIPAGTLFAKIPYTSTVTLTTQSESGGTTNIKARYLLSATLQNGRLTITAQISAISDGSYVYTGGTFSMVTIYACKGNYDPSQIAEAGDIIKEWDKGTISVSAGNKWTATETLTLTGDNANLKSISCYLYENGTRRVMAYARISSDGGITPEPTL